MQVEQSADQDVRLHRHSVKRKHATHKKLGLEKKNKTRCSHA